MTDYAFTAPAPEGGRYNGQLYAAGWGEMKIKVVSIEHGLSIFSSEDRTRFAKIEYPFKVADADFSITLSFRNHEVYEAFANRMRDYVRLAADPDASVGAMVVIVPDRDFTRFGVPTRGVTYGDKAGAITHSMTITFTAAEDPLSILSAEDLSHSVDISETNAMYYPAEVGHGAEFALYNGTKVPTIHKTGPS